jgi:hypothetical protein
MHPTNCLNCGTLLTADDNFCPYCGQKSHTHKLTIIHLLHEFFHSFTHADKGFLGITADLAIRPGVVARQYIQGKRKKYFNPFTYFLLCLAILVFCANTFKSFHEPLKIDQSVVQRIPTDEQRKTYIGFINRTNAANAFVKKNMNVISMLMLPIFSFLSWLFFKKRGYNYAELTVVYMMYSSFASLLFAILILPWLGAVNPSQVLYFAAAAMLLQVLYVGIAHYRFFQFKNPFSVLLPMLVTLLGTIFLVLLLMVGMYYYIFRSGWWKMMQLTWKELTA